MKYTYVFAGQSASCGTPNKFTGRMSTYGDIYKFRCRKTAEKFAEKIDTGYADTIVSVGGRRAMREYCLGESVENFNEDLDNLQVDEVLDR